MKFFCTAGRGTEIFVVEEIRQLFGQDTKIISTEGKLYFIANNYEPDTMKKLMSLRTVERVFVEVLHDNISKLDRRGLLTLLHTGLNDKDIWEECISTLKHLSISSLVTPQNTVSDCKTDTSVSSKHKNAERLTPGINTSDNTITTGEQKDAGCLTLNVTGNETVRSETGEGLPNIDSNDECRVSETDMMPEIVTGLRSVTNGRLPTVDVQKEDTVRNFKENFETGALKINNKRKMSESDTSVSAQNYDVNDKTLGTDSSKSVVHSTNIINVSETSTSASAVQVYNGKTELETTGSINTVVSQLHSDTRMSETVIIVKNTSLTPSSSDLMKNSSVCCKYSHSIKKRRLDRNYTCTFRVSCRFSGYARKQLNVKRTSQQMGVLISKLLGWKIDLKHPKYEINIHLGDGTFTVGIPVTEIPLSKRSYIKHCGLRTTIAYIMFSLLDISPGNVVLDPMCGYATILIEASEVCQTAVYIGMDNDVSQLRIAAENIEYCHHRNVSLIHGDSRHIPLSDNSVDSVITDAPFGQNHVVTGDLNTFYCQMLTELARVVKYEGRIVLLTSSDMVQCVTKLCSQTLTNTYPNILLSNTDTSLEGDRESFEDVGDFENNSGSRDLQLVDKISKQEVAVRCSKNSNSDFDTSGGHLSIFLIATHNVKLGETEGCIFVMQKSIN